MHGDLDDTRIAVPRTRDDSLPEADGDATIVRDRMPMPPALLDPPALIEPPAPERPSMPVAVPAVVAPAVPEATALPDAPPASEPEPRAAAPVYRVRLADGREVEVDRPVYVGRKPSAPRIHTGPPPRLVTFPSPSRELSATHLELRLVGASLVATDMRSTNGTVVRLPGAAPRALLRGESIVVVPGTRLDLGDGAVLDILSPAEES